MTIDTLPAVDVQFAVLYVEVQQFYARHMHVLDLGLAEEWAETFTEDGVFDAPGLPAPVAGRAALAAGLRRTTAELAAAGEVHRHWHGMLSVTADGDAIRVRCYAIVLASTVAGGSRVHRSCVCEDELVRVDGRLVISRRRVSRDDRP